MNTQSSAARHKSYGRSTPRHTSQFRFMKAAAAALLVAYVPLLADAPSGPVVHRSFEGDLANSVSPELPGLTREPSSFGDGRVGRGLDLTRNAVHRYPVDLGEIQTLKGDASFAVEVWVRMDPGTKDDNRIVSCMDGFSGWRGTVDETRGWAIRATPDGSWSWQIQGPAHHEKEGPKKKAATTVGMMFRGIDRDNPSYSYRATPERQPINDGRWHQLAFTLDREIAEARLYYDGRNVAIYDTGWLGNIADSSHTVVGGILARWQVSVQDFFEPPFIQRPHKTLGAAHLNIPGPVPGNRLDGSVSGQHHRRRLGAPSGALARGAP